MKPYEKDRISNIIADLDIVKMHLDHIKRLGKDSHEVTSIMNEVNNKLEIIYFNLEQLQKD